MSGKMVKICTNMHVNIWLFESNKYACNYDGSEVMNMHTKFKLGSLITSLLLYKHSFK